MSTETRRLPKKRCTDPACCTFDIPVHTDFKRCVACGEELLDDVTAISDLLFGTGNPFGGRP